jgi:hypothetical protein
VVLLAAAAGAALWWASAPRPAVWLRRDAAVERMLAWAPEHVRVERDANGSVSVRATGGGVGVGAHMTLFPQPSSPGAPPTLAVVPSDALTLRVGGPDGRDLPPIAVVGLSLDGEALFLVAEPTPVRSLLARFVPGARPPSAVERYVRSERRTADGVAWELFEADGAEDDATPGGLLQLVFRPER